GPNRITAIRRHAQLKPSERLGRDACGERSGTRNRYGIEQHPDTRVVAGASLVNAEADRLPLRLELHCYHAAAVIPLESRRSDRASRLVGRVLDDGAGAPIGAKILRVVRPE